MNNKILMWLFVVVLLVSSVSATTINDFSVTPSSSYILSDFVFSGNISSDTITDIELQVYNGGWINKTSINFYTNLNGYTNSSEYTLTHNGDANPLQYVTVYAHSGIVCSGGGNLSLMFGGTPASSYCQVTNPAQSGIPEIIDLTFSEPKEISSFTQSLYGTETFRNTDTLLYVGMNGTDDFTLVDNHTGNYSTQVVVTEFTPTVGDTLRIVVLGATHPTYPVTWLEWLVEGKNISSPYEVFFDDKSISELDELDEYDAYDVRLYINGTIISDNLTIDYLSPWSSDITIPSIMYTGETYNININVTNIATNIDSVSVYTNYTETGGYNLEYINVGDNLSASYDELFDMTASANVNVLQLESLTSKIGGAWGTYQAVSNFICNGGINCTSNNVYWATTATNVTNYALFDFGVITYIEKLHIESHGSLYPKMVLVEFSDNGINYTEEYINYSMINIQDMIFNETKSGRYMRVSLGDAATGGYIYANYLQIYKYNSSIGLNETIENFNVTFNNILDSGVYRFLFNITSDSNIVYSTYQDVEIRPKPILTDYYLYPESMSVNEDIYVYANFSHILSITNTKLSYSEEIINGNFLNNEEIYGIGDSIMSSGVYLSRLDALMGSNMSATNSTGGKIYNKGIGGNTCAQTLARWETDIPENKMVMIQCGINDIFGGSETAVATSTTAMQAIQDLADSRGNELIWINVGTAGSYMCPGASCRPNLKDDILEMNVWMNDVLAPQDNNVVVDQYSSIYNGTDAYCGDGLCNADGLHLSAAGGVVVGDLIWEEVFNKQKYGYYKYTIAGLEEDVESDTFVFTLFGANEYISSNVEIFSVVFLNPLYSDAVEDGINGIKYAAFAGFGLIAIALLATIGFMFIKMFNDGFDSASLIAVTIMAIGLAIVLFVGYIIISSVASGVTL